MKISAIEFTKSNMSNYKAKNNALSDLKSFKKVDDAILRELEEDGYATVARDEQQKPIVARITKEGIAFLDSGGYSSYTQTKIRGIFKTVSIAIWKWVIGIFTAILIAWITWYLGF